MKKKVTLLIMSLALALAFCASPIASEMPGSEVEAATVKINKKKATIIKGYTLKLKIKGTSKKVTWKSSKKSVATVNKNGKVTAKKKGTATITATVGGKKYKCKITVENPKLNKKSITLSVGNTTTLKVSGTSQKVTWQSSNTSVASVNFSGKVTAKKKGTASIKAKVGKVTIGSCTVTVKQTSQTNQTGQTDATTEESYSYGYSQLKNFMISNGTEDSEGNLSYVYESAHDDGESYSILTITYNAEEDNYTLLNTDSDSSTSTSTMTLGEEIERIKYVYNYNNGDNIQFTATTWFDRSTYDNEDLTFVISDNTSSISSSHSIFQELPNTNLELVCTLLMNVAHKAGITMGDLGFISYPIQW